MNGVRTLKTVLFFETLTFEKPDTHAKMLEHIAEKWGDMDAQYTLTSTATSTHVTYTLNVGEA